MGLVRNSAEGVSPHAVIGTPAAALVSGAGAVN
eukprot:COSAG06_NODE_43523_length_371_cov_0.812500_1_plen_32_part_10